MGRGGAAGEGGSVKCTWVDCQNEAAHPQIAKDGEQWANLCDEHNSRIDEGFKSLDAKTLLGNWVKAGGGAKKMADRMMK